jgi:hypothetical protein
MQKKIWTYSVTFVLEVEAPVGDIALVDENDKTPCTPRDYAADVAAAVAEIVDAEISEELTTVTFYDAWTGVAEFREEKTVTVAEGA